MVTPEDDFPHPVPPQAFMTWKENWVFPAVDTEQRVASLFHFSLRPGAGEGIFTAKFSSTTGSTATSAVRPCPRDLTEFVPVAEREDRLRGREPGERFQITYIGDELDAEHRVHGALPDLGLRRQPPRPRRLAARRPRPARLPLPPLRAGAPARGHDRAARPGPRAGETIRVSGYATATTPGAGARTSPSATTTGSARRSRTATSRAR